MSKHDDRPAAKPRARKKRETPAIRLNLPLWLCVVLLVAAIAACFALNAASDNTPPDGELRVHFIDVGQGDAALLVTSDAAILIDAGPTDTRYETAKFVARFADKLDMMILTHPHEDHIGGAAQLLEEMRVDKVILPDITSEAGAFVRTLDAIEQSAAVAELAEAGDVYEVGDMRLTVLAPLLYYPENVNDCSLVVRVDYGETSFLFTGDAESASEADMLGEYTASALDCDVLKVGHHGSHTSSTPEFLAAVTPQIAVISVERGNDYGHPHTDTLRRLADCGADYVYRTDELGTITLVSDGKTVHLK